MKKGKTAVQTLTARSFKTNKGRNLVSILAIIMTTLMFTTLFVLIQSQNENMVRMNFRQSGYDAHISIKKITDQQIEQLQGHEDIKEMGTSIVLGVAENEVLRGRQVEIRYGTDGYAAHSFAAPTTGRLPEQEDEIALDTLILERLGVPAEIGQQVTLKWRKDYSTEEYLESTFSLCGFWVGNESSYASMAWVDRDFVLAACEGVDTPAEGQICGQRMAQITLPSDKNMEAVMDGILTDSGLEGLEYNVNIAYDEGIGKMALMESLPMYLGMLLVFVAGYLIIYNIFQISVALDIQFYGKLKTLGMTTRQVKKMIYGQANRLSLIGIPLGLLAGYLLGVVLVPILLAGRGNELAVSANPIIFIGSTIFAYLTVVISCMYPAKIAGRVSPMEALRYNDSSENTGKKLKKSRGGASIGRMAWANLGRNKKRTILVICSLTLGLVLLSSFYVKNNSFDIDKYLTGLTIADFEVADASLENYMGSYDEQGTTVSPELVGQLAAVPGAEVSSLYSKETQIKLSDQAAANIKDYYEKNNAMEIMKDDPEWIEGYQSAIEQQEVGSVIFGAERLVWDVLAESRHLIDGSFDAAAFSGGDYVLAVGIGTEDYSEQMPTYSVGDKVELGGRQFTVMGIVYPVSPVTEGQQSSAYSVDFILPADTFRQMWPENTVRKLFINASEGAYDQVQTILSDYQKNVEPSMPIVSRQTMIEQYQNETGSSAVMGNMISLVIALVGVLNFINSMVTAIISRKREFAMMQSVGMTKRQLCRMLIFEGLSYAGLTLICAYTISTAAISTVIRGMVEGGYTTYQFTLLPLLICTPILIGFAVLIPYLCFAKLEKQSIIERLRSID